MFRASAAGRVVLRETHGVGGARRISEARARVDAAAFQARSIGRTVSVDATLHAFATVERVALVTGRASAGGLVGVAVTLGVGGARHAQDARVETLAVVALLVVAALVVGLASDLDAARLRVARVAGSAEADRVVVADLALGVLATVTR